MSGGAAFVILAAIGIAVAAAVRFIHAGLLTQLGLLVGVTTLAGAILSLLREVVTPVDVSGKGEPIGATTDPILLIGVSAAVWLLVALGLGVLALRETGASATPRPHPVLPDAVPA